MLINDNELDDLIHIYTNFQEKYIKDSGAYKLFTQTIAALQELKTKRIRDVLEIHK